METKLYRGLPIKPWKIPKTCQICGVEFIPKSPPKGSNVNRFCGRSCSATWRMNDPVHKAKVHTPDVAKRRGEAKSRWFKTPAAAKELERIRNLNPMSIPGVREKVSAILKNMGHRPSQRGGNGKGMTEMQSALLARLSDDWIPEYAVSLGKKTQGYPTCYKLDLAIPSLRIGIEVDGVSHFSRKDQDQKKDEKLISLGWTIIRFWNKEIKEWLNSELPESCRVYKVLMQNKIAIKESETTLL